MPTASSGISVETLRVIVANTIAVLTTVADKQQEWWQAISGALSQAREQNAADEAEFLQAILVLLEGGAADLPSTSPYAAAWAGDPIWHCRQGGRRQDASGIVAAIQAYANADIPDEIEQILQAQQAALFEPVVEKVFEQNIAWASLGPTRQVAEHADQRAQRGVCAGQRPASSVAGLRDRSARRGWQS